MKVDPKTGIRYAHTPEEWADVVRRHGAGMSLPGSVAARLQVIKPPRPKKDGRQLLAEDG
jgi:hypothetical protein